MTFTAKTTDRTFIILTASFILALAMAAYTEVYAYATVPFAGLFFYYAWQHPRIIFLWLLFSIPFSVEYLFSFGLGTDLPDEFLMILVSGLFFVYAVFHRKQIFRKQSVHPLLILVYIIIGWSLVSTLFSTNLLLSVKYMLAKGWYLGAFLLAPLIILNSRRRITIAASTFVVAMMLVTICILIRHSRYAFSFANINDAVTPFFRNHVTYSSLLVCILPILFAFYQLATTKNAKNLQAFLIGLLLVALFFSYARGAWVALLFGVMAYWLIRKKLLLYAYCMVLLLVFASTLWLKQQDRYLQYAHHYKTTIFHENFNEHLLATYQLQDVSTAERFYRWIAGVRMIKDKPLTGYGPSTFYSNYKPYTVPSYKTWVSNNPEHSTVHNYFLLTLIEQGIPGLCFFILLTAAMLYYAQRLYHRAVAEYDKTTAITIGSILVMLLTVNFLSDLIETDKIGSLFFLCISLLMIVDKKTKKESDPSLHI